MKKLSKMLLIHWYTYEREIIEFGNLNFLTGKTASGKSTIIDALQLVLLGDTNGNFFNKAANEKSVRTLKSYLFGENGDDGETGFHYLRGCTFTSYVVLEFEDTVKNTSFIAGFVADCYEDLHYDYKWIIADRMKIPDDCFTDTSTHIPYTIPELKSYLRKKAPNRTEFIDTNKRFQELALGKYGAVKRKYLVMLKKAVPFSPIADIEQFITESICDVRNNIHVEQMQSDIRQYKNLEADAERTAERIKALSEIAEASRIYEADRELERQQSYIILRAEQEEQVKEEQSLRNKEKEYVSVISDAALQVERLDAEEKTLESKISALEVEYHTSDLARRGKRLAEEMENLSSQITDLAGGVRTALLKIREYGRKWGDKDEILREAGYGLLADENSFFKELKQLDDRTLETFDFLSAASRMKHIRDGLSEQEYELKLRAGQISEDINDLSNRIAGLKKGIKPYPQQVLALKRQLEAGLFEKYKKAVEIPVFAELLEIRDASWRDAIEGYLDRQKFNLLVPKKYFADASEIYDRLRNEERIYDAGIVDLGKLQNEFRHTSRPGTLAEEVETDNPNARLYADYLLGNVYKCENVRELNRHHISITKNVMLYKNYVTRKLNPARYADPFIGRRSLELLLEKLVREQAEAKEQYERIANDCRLVKKAASTEILSPFEAESHAEAVERGKKIPELTERLEELKSEYQALDFTWLDKLKKEIDEKKEIRRNNRNERTKCAEKKARTEALLEVLADKDLKQVFSELQRIGEELKENFDEEWVSGIGEPRFLKELKAREGRTAVDTAANAMGFKESFQRARKQTITRKEKHLIERRRLRGLYNQEYKMPYDIERADNSEFDEELRNLSEIRLPFYVDQIKDAKEKAYNQFRDDFIAKLKSNIEAVKAQISELNYSLKDSVFGTDRYRFVITPRAEYRDYYEMITDPMLMDTGGWNIASQNFNQKYQKEIDALFKALMINDAEMTAERRAEYERNIKKYTDYKTYLVFDLIVTNDQGEEQRLSKTLLKKSGGETQIPFYIALLASFSQVCRIRVKGKNNTIRLIILDEAFSKMDGERIQEAIALLRRFGLQAVFSAPPDKIPDIAPRVDSNIAVYKDGHHSFTRHFDPAQIMAAPDMMEEV